MQVLRTPFDGLLELMPTIYSDNRGWFYESFKNSTFRESGIEYDFLQDNQSFSRKGVIRGLHFQREPYAQAKLAMVLVGKVLDVVVDLRPGSQTFGKVYKCVLDGERRNMLMVPDGFAHGFAALEDSMFLYKCSKEYHKEAEGGIIWNDPDLNIDWQVANPIISEKDQKLPAFRDLVKNL